MVYSLTYEEEVVEYEEPAPDLEPPSIELTGAADDEVEQFSVYFDPGALANDLVDGYVPCHRVDDLGALDTSHMTGTGEPYILMYRATDAAGNAAEVQRRVTVVSPCLAPSYACSGGAVEEAWTCATCEAETCLCLTVIEEEEEVATVEEFVPAVDSEDPELTLLGDGELAQTSDGVMVMLHVLQLNDAGEEVINTPPELQLVGPAEVYVGQGLGYAACQDGVSLNASCDRGASATDAEDGNLDAVVLACSPDGVSYKFIKKGVQGCAIDTRIPEPHQQRYGHIAKPHQQRYGHIAEPHQQSSMECATRDLLRMSGAVTPDVTPPAITLRGAPRLRLAYGAAVQNLSLLPCAQQGDTIGCYAVALDDTDGDISDQITVAMATSSTGDVCSIDLVPSASCFPAIYTYEYYAADQ
eukprot:gene24389-29644_t